MVQDFDVNLLEMKCAAIETALRSERQSHDIVEVGLPLLDEAVGEENYEVLARLMKALRISTNKLRPDDVLRLPAERGLAHAEKVKKEHEKLKTSLAALVDNPENAKANLEVGKFHCIWRHDWEEALPLLARGGDTLLKSLVEKDRANPNDPEEQAALGAAWRKYALQVNSASFKEACQKRAYFWYQFAAMRLKGTKLTSVEQAMKALAKVVPELQNPWWQFGVYAGATLDPATGYLRIRPPHSIATRQCYQGPLDITVVARAMKTDLNIDIGQGGRVRIGEDLIRKVDQLRVHRPDAPGLIGTQADVRSVSLPTNRSFTIRWQITANRMKVWLDGELLFEETREYDRRGKLPVVIHCGAAPMELKAVLVKRPAEK